MKKLTEQDLLDLKKDIDKSKLKVAELTGEKKSITQQLKNDWNCSDIEQAKKKLKSLEKDIETTERQIDKVTKELEEEYLCS